MPIVQATHINHYQDDEVGPPVEPSAQLATLAEAEKRKPPTFFVRNPKVCPIHLRPLQWPHNCSSMELAAC
jgi:hypothetical protein